MVNFTTIDLKTFLSDYWQKKPLLIRNALPDFINPLTPDELAGLALDEEVESRMVFHTPAQAPYWQLKRGPFLEGDFSQLPTTHWTLLVQGVDQLVPEVADILESFNFIPSWRLDDVMISYAVTQGSVGPHYDHYDVFLYQASGQRKWSLTTKHCHETNYVKDVELRIMAQFDVEQEYILEPGDMLYLPPHVGHHGVSLSDDCMTYSVGYRSYRGQELLNSFNDYLAETGQASALYCDPNWNDAQGTSVIPPQAWMNAKKVLQHMLDDDNALKTWFGCFATQLDQQTELHMPIPLEEEEWGELSEFLDILRMEERMFRDATCRMAYEHELEQVKLFINGVEWETQGVSGELLRYVANHRVLELADLKPYVEQSRNQELLYDLWKLQWLQFESDFSNED